MTAAPLILTERTPNPEALRILPGVSLKHGAPIELRAGDDPGGSPLAAALLEIEGIAGILIGSDFVTVVRSSPDHGWSELKPLLLAAVADALACGRPLLPDAVEQLDPTELDDISNHIREVIDRFVRPLVARDGGETTFARFDTETGIAYVRMSGACGGCPSGRTTLKGGIERIIRRYVPEVVKVEAESARNGDDTDPKARFRAWVAARFPKFS